MDNFESTFSGCGNEFLHPHRDLIDIVAANDGVVINPAMGIVAAKGTLAGVSLEPAAGELVSDWYGQSYALVNVPPGDYVLRAVDREGSTLECTPVVGIPESDGFSVRVVADTVSWVALSCQ